MNYANENILAYINAYMHIFCCVLLIVNWHREVI